MPKHRGLILEHQTSTPASLSDFSMKNSINSSNLRFCSTRAMIDLGLELGNKGFVRREMAWGEEASF